MVEHIRQKFPTFPVVYGGALIPGNVSDYLQFSILAGVFVGEFSLEPDQFAGICNRS